MELFVINHMLYKKETTPGSKKPLLLPSILMFFCGIFGTYCSNFPQPTSSGKPDSAKNDELQEKNTRQALELFQTLYSEYTMDIAGTPKDSSDDVLVGAQRGYLGKPETPEADSALVRYGRIWAYDTGIGLSLAVANEDPTAHRRALWILHNGRYIQNPKNPEMSVFAGWPFSMNQAHLGDNWEDMRRVTGANTFVAIGLADYLASDLFQELSPEDQLQFSTFFGEVLEGILYHFEMDGPNEGLISAGWSINALDEAETKNAYYELLDVIGYGAQKVDGYSKTIETTRAEHIVTEHCNDVLKLLNLTLRHFDTLLGFEGAPYTYQDLNALRLKLRVSTLDKLFDKKERRMVTGRNAAGIPSESTAIDNASWLALSIDLYELNSEQIEVIADSLAYTVSNFTADFTIGDNAYFGAHYFSDGFEDPYAGRSTTSSKSYHIEATCGLIYGLLRFSQVFPDHPNSPLFYDVAVKLWADMQGFINDFGFVYASASENDTSEPEEASISAIWYLMTLNDFDDDLHSQ